jgi:hypothetical protein
LSDWYLLNGWAVGFLFGVQWFVSDPSLLAREGIKYPGSFHYLFSSSCRLKRKSRIFTFPTLLKIFSNRCDTISIARFRERDTYICQHSNSIAAAIQKCTLKFYPFNYIIFSSVIMKFTAGAGVQYRKSHSITLTADSAKYFFTHFKQNSSTVISFIVI